MSNSDDCDSALLIFVLFSIIWKVFKILYLLSYTEARWLERQAILEIFTMKRHQQ